MNETLVLNLQEMRRTYNIIKGYDMIEPVHVDEFIKVFEKPINKISSTVLRTELNNILSRYVQNLNMFIEQDKWENKEIEKMFVHYENMIKIILNHPQPSSNLEGMTHIEIIRKTVTKEFNSLPYHKQNIWEDRFRSFMRTDSFINPISDSNIFGKK